MVVYHSPHTYTWKYHSTNMTHTPATKECVILATYDTIHKSNCKSLWESKKSVYLRHHLVLKPKGL